MIRNASSVPVGSHLPAPRPPSESPAALVEEEERNAIQANMQSMLSEWNSLSKRMSGMIMAIGSPAQESNRGTKTPEKPRSAEKLHTPLGEGALKKATEYTRYRPEIRRGKLYFSCPACHSPTAVFKFYAGAKTRCPNCLSAIRTPDLKRSKRAFNLERDIAAFIHPEWYEAVLPRRRSIATVIPLPKLNTTLAAAGLTLLFGVSSLSFRIAGAKEKDVAPPSIEQEVIPQDTVDLSGRAVAVVTAFLEAEGAVAKSAFVKDGARVARLMARSFQRTPDSEPIGYRSITPEVTGLSPAEGANHFVSHVNVDIGSGRAQSFVVEHLPHGDYIEWEASTGFNEHGWDNIARRAADGGTKVAQLRVFAAPDDYYNYRYCDDREHVCLRLQDSRSNEMLGYGYATREQAERLGLIAATSGASQDAPEKLTLDLLFHEDSARTRQVEILGLAQEGWRAPSGTMLATTDSGEPE